MTPTVEGTLVDFALAGFGSRLASSPDLTDLVPAGDIEEGPDTEVWHEPSRDLFPAIRFQDVGTPDERGPRYGTVRIQVDVFVWPRDPDAPSGRTGIAKIDEAVTRVIGPGSRRWRYRGTRFSTSGSELIANEYNPDGPFRRGRRVGLEVMG